MRNSNKLQSKNVMLILIIIFFLQMMACDTSSKPNIILMVADDMGWADIGYHNPEIKTPNLDRLASEGIELDYHYVQPQCTPTRVALMTGRYPNRFGRHCTQASNVQAFPFRTETLASLLNQIGYETAMTGKWHLGSLPEWGPLKYGFNNSHGSFAGAVGMYDHRYRLNNPKYAITWHYNDVYIQEEGHVTDLCTDQAVKWVRLLKKPYFIYVPFHTVHTPLVETEKWLQINDHIKDPDPALKNGFSSNLPLRGGKVTVYEGGIRVPAFVYWKGQLNPMKVSLPVHAVDWMPTISNLVGYESPEDLNWDGRDIWPLITGQQKKYETSRIFYWHWAGDKEKPGRIAIREGAWKMVIPDRGREAELYNLADDPYEEVDLASDQPELIKRLQVLLDAEQVKDK